MQLRRTARRQGGLDVVRGVPSRDPDCLPAVKRLSSGQWFWAITLGRVAQVGGGFQRVDPVVSDAMGNGGKNVLPLIEGRNNETVISGYIALFNL